MAFTLQVDDGSVENANAYVSVQALRDYALDRGVGLASTTDADLEVAIVKATDFLDSAYSFIGRPYHPDQGTAFPRNGVRLQAQRGLPRALTSACCKLAMRVAQGKPLVVDPTVDPSGLTVSSKSTEVGPVKTSVAFFAPPGGQSDSLSKRFPDVTLTLRQAGLLGSGYGGQVVRG